MKIRGPILLPLICCSFLAGSISFSGASTETERPIAVLPEVQYEFEPAPDGTQILHEFQIQNKGTVELKIEKIRTG